MMSETIVTFCVTKLKIGLCSKSVLQLGSLLFDAKAIVILIMECVNSSIEFWQLCPFTAYSTKRIINPLFILSIYILELITLSDTPHISPFIFWETIFVIIITRTLDSNEFPRREIMNNFHSRTLVHANEIRDNFLSFE